MMLEQDEWSLEVAMGSKLPRLSEETRELVLRDRERFFRNWEADKLGVPRNAMRDALSSEGEFFARGWVPCDPAYETAVERGLSAETATAVLRDFGATPHEACTLSTTEFTGRFGLSWFDILPRVND